MTIRAIIITQNLHPQRLDDGDDRRNTFITSLTMTVTHTHVNNKSRMMTTKTMKAPEQREGHKLIRIAMVTSNVQSVMGVRSFNAEGVVHSVTPLVMTVSHVKSTW
jgi:hypothetical protein